ncbi:MAG: beta-lactamase family protein, partial [Thioalkalivibrio sp.]|nr:beta-lactamase family protein [Thioalkalivibrio sp.]
LMAVCIIASLATVAPAGAQDGVNLSADLAATLEDFRARYGFPGATAAIALPDGTVVTVATGLADVEFARGMTPDTPMLAASIGKTFVAATVLALESEGRLRQADLLADHLGDRPWFEDLPNAETISIAHLLRHTAGLPDHVHLPEFYGHGGWIPGYVSSLRHYADHRVTIAFQINTGAGVLDETSDVVPALEWALADLAIAAGR